MYEKLPTYSYEYLKSKREANAIRACGVVDAVGGVVWRSAGGPAVSGRRGSRGGLVSAARSLLLIVEWSSASSGPAIRCAGGWPTSCRALRARRSPTRSPTWRSTRARRTRSRAARAARCACRVCTRARRAVRSAARSRRSTARRRPRHAHTSAYTRCVALQSTLVSSRARTR